MNPILPVIWFTIDRQCFYRFATLPLSPCVPLGFVMNVIPSDDVIFSCGSRVPNSENQPPVKRLLQ